MAKASDQAGGIISIPAIGSAFIDGGPALGGKPSSRDTNFSATESLLIKSTNIAGTSLARRVYLLFDLTGVDLAHAKDATLSCFVNQNYGPTKAGVAFGIQVFGLRKAFVGDGFDESKITWNNAPANALEDGGLLAGGVQADQTVPLGTIQVTPTGGAVALESPSFLDFLKETSDNPKHLIVLILVRDSGQRDLNTSIYSRRARQEYVPTIMLHNAP